MTPQIVSKPITVDAGIDAEGLAYYFSRLEKDRDTCIRRRPMAMDEIRVAVGQLMHISSAMYRLATRKTSSVADFRAVRNVTRRVEPRVWPHHGLSSEIIADQRLHESLNKLIGEMWSMYGEAWPYLTNPAKWQKQSNGRYRWIGNESLASFVAEEFRLVIERVGGLAPAALHEMRTTLLEMSK